MTTFEKLPDAQRDRIIAAVAEHLERRYGALDAADESVAADLLAIAETAAFAAINALQQ